MNYLAFKKQAQSLVPTLAIAFGTLVMPGLLLAGECDEVFIDRFEDGTLIEYCDPARPGNNCDSELLPLASGTYSWQYTTNDFNTGSPSCTGYSANGVDRVHAVTLASGETLTVDLEATSGDPSVYLITECADPQNTCVAGSDEIGSSETLTYTSSAGGTYYFIADRYTSGSSDAVYNLNVQIDQEPEPGPGPGNNCSSEPLPLASGTYSWQYTTNDFNTGSPSCTGWPANGVDRVHAVTLAPGETLNFGSSAEFVGRSALISPGLRNPGALQPPS
jgi:hypothetical protein